MELIGKKKFTAVALDLEYKTFVVHIIALSIDLSDEVHPLKRAQIAYLKLNEVCTKISNKYADFADVFLSKLIIKLPKHMEINDYSMKLIDN